MDRMVVLIPALNPGERLLTLVTALQDRNLNPMIIIDDGSDPAEQEFFEQAERCGCRVVHHDSNQGKGAAIKTGIRTAMEIYGPGNAYLTVDADGQHLPEDVRKVADALQQHPDSLVMGSRDFSTGNVPWKSYWGNRLTKIFFRLTCGKSCPDTQTGLRGIPVRLEQLALTEEGSRYNYEMNFLMDAAGLVPIVNVPIQTVYEEDGGTHFRPFVDSVRVYSRFLRFISSSMVSFAVDYLMFLFLTLFLKMPQTQEIFLATILARITSGIVNFLLNRHFSFRSTKSVGGEVLRYGVVFVCQMMASAGLVSLVSWLILPRLVAKVIVDLCLFFLSFVVQKNWVFRKERV